MLADSRHHMGGGIQIINIFQDLINRLGKMLHLSRKIHCTESHLFCKDPVFLCKHINLEGKAVHLPEHGAILGPQIAGFQIQERTPAPCPVLLFQKEHLSGLGPDLLGIQLKDHSQKQEAVISSLMKLAEPLQHFLFRKDTPACQFAKIEKSTFQNFFFFYPLIIFQRIQKKSRLVRPLIQNRHIGLKQLAFCRVITFVFQVCQQLFCPVAPLVCREFAQAHKKKVSGCFQAFFFFIRSHVDLKLLAFGSHDLIGQGLVYGFDPDPSEVLAFSQIFPADNIFQFIDASDKVSVMDTLFLYLQKVTFHSDLSSQKSPAAAADPEGIFQRRLDLIKLQILPFQAESYRLFQISADKKFLQVLIGGRGFHHRPVTGKKILPSGQKPCKRRLHKKLVRLPEIFSGQLHKIFQGPHSSLGSPDLRGFYLNRKRHPVFSDTGA